MRPYCRGLATFGIGMLCAAAGAQAWAAGRPPAPVAAVPDDCAKAFFERELKRRDAIPLHRGLASLWLDRDVDRGNEELRRAHQGLITKLGGKDAKRMTPAIAGHEHVKWQMRTWNRVYGLFHANSPFFPGRMDRRTQDLFEDLFWNYAVQMSNYRRAGLRYVWGVHGSENHEMMHYSNALLALQAIKDAPAYRDRTLPDGRRPIEHYEAWNAYYKHYCDERARHGLLIEVFSAYGRYTMPELFNLCDLAEDPVLRKKITMLLHLVWADWAVGQIDGVRGGGKTRIYQGRASGPGVPEAEAARGVDDPWRHMSWFVLGTGRWWEHRWHPHPIRGMARVLATTRYRLPEVIRDIATDVPGRGEYVYAARRVAKQRDMRAKDVPVSRSPWYAFDSEDPRMLGYDYCTPDYVMGSLLIDPTLPLVDSHTYLKGKDLKEGYPALTSQNRYQCVIFGAGLGARVAPQCLPKRTDYRKTYGQQQAVQHKNVMIVQQHPNGRNVAGMRVFFGKGMKERLVERDGWLLLEEGNAYLAVKAFSRKPGAGSCGVTWKNEFWAHLNEGDAPTVFVAGRRATSGHFEAFAASVLKHKAEIQGAAFTYAFKDAAGADATLRLYLDASRPPEVDGRPIDFRPAKVFDCPFFDSKHGSGVVTMRKGGERLVLDFNTTTVR